MGQQLQGLSVVRNAFGLQHMHQVLGNGLRGHGPQIELQATRQHRDGHLLRVGGGQDELQILRRLFQSLEHGVEGRVGEHVHFVNHEDFEATLHRFVDRLLEQLLNFFDAAVGSRVQLGVIDESSGIDVLAGGAHATGLGGDAGFTVQRFGQHA